MLVVDSFKGHTTSTSKALLAANKYDLTVMPGGTTFQLQPLDVRLNKPMKHRIQKAYMEWVVERYHKLQTAARLKHALLSLLAQ